MIKLNYHGNKPNAIAAAEESSGRLKNKGKIMERKQPEGLLWLCVQGMAMGTRTLSSNGYNLINDNNIMQCAFFDILNYEIHTYIYN